MCKYGDTVPFGNQVKVFTPRGWVICDNTQEVREEQDAIAKMSETQEEQNS